LLWLGARLADESQLDGLDILSWFFSAFGLL